MEWGELLNLISAHPLVSIYLGRVAEIREVAAIDFDVKFMGLRHGGNTESGNADLTDAQIRALSGHKTSAMTALYTKATMQQRRAGARKRLQERTKEGNLSK
jgi:integrase